MELPISTLTSPQLGLASSNPAAMSTTGPVTFRAASHSETIAHASTATASAMSVASFTAGTRPFLDGAACYCHAFYQPVVW